MSIGRVPGSTGIQPSIVTAKGDLIVATASGSVTNQAVGSNNQVLTADSAQADGVKWANGSAATLTTTGDILYASSANTPARLGIGSSGQVLTVSGGVPSWATAASVPTFAGVRLVNSGSITVPTGTTTVITFDTERIDTNNFHSTITDTSRITIPSGYAGYYHFNANIVIKSGGTATNRQIFLYRNGSERSTFWKSSSVNEGANLTIDLFINCSVGDYFEIYARQDSGGDRTVMGNNEFLDGLYFQAYRIGV